MANKSKRLFSSFHIFANGALSLVAVLMLAVPSYAEVVEYFSDFTPGCMPAGSYRQNNIASNLDPFFSNFSFYKVATGTYFDSNLRYANTTDGYILLATGSNQRATFQLTASSFLKSATCFDLTAGDLVYESSSACNWKGNVEHFYQGISINNNAMTLYYQPGLENGQLHIDGFSVSETTDLNFTPAAVGEGYTKMKLTIHRDEANGNYVFTTQMGLATSADYTFTSTYTRPIAAIDAAGGIQSIGPLGDNNNNNCVSYLRLLAPFADDAVNSAKSTAELRDMFIASDKPVHWYKFDDSSTTTVKDYGSSPKDGTATNVNMTTISELNQVAEFSGSGSKVSVVDSSPIDGPWTAEFFLNSAQMDSWQSLVQSGSYSLRWSQYGNAGTPGFTVSGDTDYVFLDPDGGAFDYEIPTNEWLHVTYVNDGESMLLYIDGELAGKNTERLIPLPYTTIGANGNSGYFQGMIDYVALYDYALSAEQIWNHAHPTPEPATWALLILGAAGMLYFRKR